MKAIIIDDEENSAQLLKILIEQNCPELEVLAVFINPHEAIKAIKSKKPDLVFLDVEMPEMNGFDLLEAIRGNFKAVVFTTAHSQYVIKALRASAFDYLQKPIDVNDLTEMVKRAIQKTGKENKSPQTEEIHHRLERLENAQRKPNVQRLAVQSADGYNMIAFDEIIRLEAESNYTHIYTLNKKYTVARLLRNYEEQLLEAGFIRVHNSHLVNVKHVRHYQRGDGGYLIMSDKSNVEVSRSRKKEVLRILLGEE
ncbi:MAG: LytTR family DNA-binding domain-containing protein [Bacteroidia bacterium]|jgi:two-component system LytT family response regulator|nr:LytTR family DNA-binding domain-containing protein [Bacteroidia bacterium]